MEKKQAWNSTTVNAYNNWGGKSLYKSDDGVPAVEVSFLRPPKGSNIDPHEVWLSGWMKAYRWGTPCDGNQISNNICRTQRGGHEQEQSV